MDEQVWLGLPYAVKIRVRSLVYLSVEPVHAVMRPSASHLVIKLVAVDTFSEYSLAPVHRQNKKFAGYRCGSIEKNLCELFHLSPLALARQPRASVQFR